MFLVLKCGARCEEYVLLMLSAFEMYANVTKAKGEQALMLRCDPRLLKRGAEYMVVPKW